VGHLSAWARDDHEWVAGEDMSFDDSRMELIMGRLLQVGVLLSSTCVLLGGGLLLHEHIRDRVDYRVFVSEPATLRTVHGLVLGLRAGRPEAMIQLGVLLLIATPIARVVFALVSFVIERDRLYVGISVVILAVLIFGLLQTV
jgi:uncharacterized membrane protein